MTRIREVDQRGRSWLGKSVRYIRVNIIILSEIDHGEIIKTRRNAEISNTQNYHNYMRQYPSLKRTPSTALLL